MQYKLMNIPYNNYKTQKCKYFEQEKMCRFGKNCTYAHGQVDLRQPYEDMTPEQMLIANQPQISSSQTIVQTQITPIPLL